MVFEVLGDAAFLVFHAPGVAGHVAFFGEDQQVVVFVGLGEGGDQAGGVPEVDVLIDHAVDKQELALEARDLGEDGAIEVALGV